MKTEDEGYIKDNEEGISSLGRILILSDADLADPRIAFLPRSLLPNTYVLVVSDSDSLPLDMPMLLLIGGRPRT